MTADEITKLAAEVMTSGIRQDGARYVLPETMLIEMVRRIEAVERERIIKANAPEIEKVNAYIKALEKPDLARVGEVGIWCDCGDGIMPNSGAKCGNCIAAESAAREWVGLTRDEVLDIEETTKHPLAFYEAIEAKLKEKNR